MQENTVDDDDYAGPLELNIWHWAGCLVFLGVSLYAYALLATVLWEQRLVVACLFLSGLLVLRTQAFLKALRTPVR